MKQNVSIYIRQALFNKWDVIFALYMCVNYILAQFLGWEQQQEQSISKKEKEMSIRFSDVIL